MEIYSQHLKTNNLAVPNTHPHPKTVNNPYLFIISLLFFSFKENIVNILNFPFYVILLFLSYFPVKTKTYENNKKK